MRTRLAKPSHVEWKPSDGQLSALGSLITKTRCALWADPGAGKTSITLAAFTELKRASPRATMLVVAPLRVCQLQWRQEASQWSQFMHHKIVFLHGPKKDDLLREHADIYLINFDGLVWLDKKFPRGLPFDIVCLDESTKIKNYSAERSKALRRCTKNTPRKWMLTGTPSPNGYMDIFGQFLWLDGGQALGQYITHFREKFFNKAFNGFDYDLQKGGDMRIEQRIANLVHRLPFTDLPPLTNDVRMCEMGAEGRKLYKAMDKEQVVVIGDHTIVAGSTGAHQSAKEQMAQGAIYTKPGEHDYVAFDDAKLDALDELIEEMNGQPLLVAFQFHHDIERIRARRGKDIHVLAGGVTEKVAEEIQRAWNAGEITELYVHPASIGHGLNLQRGGASHICWFTPTFDLELWEQLIRRIWRQGNKAPRIVNHVLAMKGTIDEDKLEAMADKALDQARLLHSMEKDTALPVQKETTMTDQRLGFQAGNAPAPSGGWGPQANGSPPTQQGGWGPQANPPAPAAAPAVQQSWGQQAAPAPQPAGNWGAPQPAAPQPLAYTTETPPQQQNIQHGGERLDAAQGGGMGHFSPGVQQAAATVGQPINGSFTPANEQTAPAVEQEKPRATRTSGGRKVAAENKPAAGSAVDTAQEYAGAKFAESPFEGRRHITVTISGDSEEVKAILRKLAL